MVRKEIPMDSIAIPIDSCQVSEICQRYGVSKLEVFGSAIRADFNAESDVDLLVTFLPGRTPGWDFVALKMELESIMGRPVDLLTRAVVERDDNHIFRDHVLAEPVTIYAFAA